MGNSDGSPSVSNLLASGWDGTMEVGAGGREECNYINLKVALQQSDLEGIKAWADWLLREIAKRPAGRIVTTERTIGDFQIPAIIDRPAVEALLEEFGFGFIL